MTAPVAPRPAGERTGGGPVAPDRPGPPPAGPGRSPGLAHLAAAAVFAVALFGYFAPALVGGRAFTVTATQQDYVYPWAATPHGYPFALQSDQADLSLPALKVQQRAYAAGELPYVDLDSYGGGTPLFADFSTGQAYPPRILAAWLLSPLDAHLAYTLAHLFAAGMFTYLLIRRGGGRWTAGVLAGSAWMLGAWSLAWMHLAPVVVVVALLPASLWAVHRAVERRTLAAVTVAGVCLGATVVAGHALFGLVTVAVAGTYGLCLCGRELVDRRGDPDRRVRWRIAAVVPGAVVVAVALWAFILVPLAVGQEDSSRAGLTYDELTTGQLAPLRYLLNVLWPFATPIDMDHLNALSFVGVLTGVLAAVGLVTRRPGSGLGRGLALTMGALMVGGPVTWLAFHLVPTMDVFRPYARLALYLGFGVVLLGAAGADWLVDRGEAVLARTGRPGLRPVAGAALALLVAANAVHLMAHGRQNNPGFPPDDAAAAFPETPLVRALRDAAGSTANGWPGRAAVISPVERPGGPWDHPILWAAHGAYLGIETSSGYNSVMPPRAQRTLRMLAGEDLDSVLARAALGSYLPELWWGVARHDLFPRNGYDLVVTPPPLGPTSAWGVEHVAPGRLEALYEGPDGNVYQIVGARPGARGVTAVEVVDDERRALERFTDGAFDAVTTVLLSSAAADALAVPAPGAGPLPLATVSDARRGPNGYRFTARAEDRTLVVVPVNWDAGWSATVDGRPVPLRRANYNQLVLPVPAGTSEVALVYRPPGLTAGLAVSGSSGAALLAAGAVGVALRRHRRHAPRPAAAVTRGIGAREIRVRPPGVP